MNEAEAHGNLGLGGTIALGFAVFYGVFALPQMITDFMERAAREKAIPPIQKAVGAGKSDIDKIKSNSVKTPVKIVAEKATQKPNAEFADTTALFKRQLRQTNVPNWKLNNKALGDTTRLPSKLPL